VLYSNDRNETRNVNTALDVRQDIFPSFFFFPFDVQPWLVLQKIGILKIGIF
jgi:hypothetical protein